MFIRPDSKLETEKLENQEADFTIINASGLKLEKNIIEQLGLNSEAFIILNIEKKIGIIGGTSYAGEMKKSIFSLMNYWLPNDDILTMHYSANFGKNKDTVLFFGLSGTGKTALSADPNRFLIGDDEHGWNNQGIFNLEGGCYAKTINLNRKSEPEIYDANITENGRASYPIHHIKNFSKESVLDHPKNIIFLTCDAFGILPPVSKLTNEEAMYHFLSGYTAKVAGTERGITEPTATFSACYGEPFLPLHPYRYAELLEKKISEHNSNVYLVNTGWYKGGYGKGERMNIELTRSCINSILDNSILNSTFEKLPIFNLSIPNELEYIPNSILNPINTWGNKQEYYKESEKLAQMFISNFERYNDNINMKNLIKYGPII
jgi:phosphoenolpyruvate carboxykinase (ATP)